MRHIEARVVWGFQVSLASGRRGGHVSVGGEVQTASTQRKRPVGYPEEARFGYFPALWKPYKTTRTAARKGIVAFVAARRSFSTRSKQIHAVTIPMQCT